METTDFNIQTWKGHTIDLRHGPKSNQVDIEDIAHSLSMQVRFCGHVNRFYSIAEHSIYVAMLANKMHRAYYLLHDAHEYIYHDISSPLKRLLATKFSNGNAYRDLCDNTDKTIVKALGLNVVGFDNLKKDIKEADMMLLNFEQKYLFGRVQSEPIFPEDHPLHGAPFGLSPDQAEIEFVQYFKNATV